MLLLLKRSFPLLSQFAHSIEQRQVLRRSPPLNSQRLRSSSPNWSLCLRIIRLLLLLLLLLLLSSLLLC